MNFPDDTKKEGYFENNVYKIKVQISGNAEGAEFSEEIKTQNSLGEAGNSQADGNISPYPQPGMNKSRSNFSNQVLNAVKQGSMNSTQPQAMQFSGAMAQQLPGNSSIGSSSPRTASSNYPNKFQVS